MHHSFCCYKHSVSFGHPIKFINRNKVEHLFNIIFDFLLQCSEKRDLEIESGLICYAKSLNIFILKREVQLCVKVDRKVNKTENYQFFKTVVLKEICLMSEPFDF